MNKRFSSEVVANLPSREWVHQRHNNDFHLSPPFCSDNYLKANIQYHQSYIGVDTKIF